MNYFVSLELMDITVWSMTLLKRIHGFLSRLLPAVAICLFFLCLPVPASADSMSVPDGNTGDLIITEVMVKNHAVVQDQEGDFPDWIELCNNSGADLDLTGWSLTDRQGKDGLVFPSYLLPADSYLSRSLPGKTVPPIFTLPSRFLPGKISISRIRRERSSPILSAPISLPISAMQWVLTAVSPSVFIPLPGMRTPLPPTMRFRNRWRFPAPSRSTR